MKKIWTTPSGKVNELYEDMLQQPHLLIAGATGSGKSVVINGLISTALFDSPAKVEFILIDPKRVELAEYKHLPHTLAHAAGLDPDAWNAALNKACAIMDQRYTDMERRRLKMWDGSDLYVIIDEFALVRTNGGVSAYRSVLRLTSEGRAARIHCIIATQVPKATIIPTEIRENCSARLCLRTNNAMQSRVIMDQRGCETLPDYGYGYYVKPCYNKLCSLRKIPDQEQANMVDYWMTHRPKIRLFA